MSATRLGGSRPIAPRSPARLTPASRSQASRRPRPAWGQAALNRVVLLPMVACIAAAWTMATLLTAAWAALADPRGGRGTMAD